MKTPGHVVVNVALLSAVLPPDVAVPVLVGAVLPDVPIFALYAWGRFALRMPEERIWRELYPRRAFLALVHGLHSFVVAGAGLALCIALDVRVGVAICVSMLLHAALDIPVHGEDAHRHFWPLSEWRFVSKLSYWDPKLHAKPVALVEALLVVACAALLWNDAGVPSWLRGAALLTALLYPGHWVLVFVAPRAQPGTTGGHG